MSTDVAVALRYYTPKEAAPLLGLKCEESVTRLIRSKKLNCTIHRLNHKPRYAISDADIAAYHANNRAFSDAEARRVSRPKVHIKQR